MNDDTPRIEGIPSKDGAYWYYKRGKLLPSLVLIGTRNGERVINDSPAMQRFWYPGECFVGPIEPPFATLDDLAGRKYGEELYLQEAVGTAVSDQR